MKLEKRRIRFLTALLMVSLMLTSCDDRISYDSPDNSEIEYDWVSKQYDLDFAISITSASAYGNDIYFSTVDPKVERYWCGSEEQGGASSYSEFYRWEIGSSEPERLELNGNAAKLYWYEINIQPDNLGNLYLAYNGRIAKFDSSGEQIYCTYIKDEHYLADYSLCATSVDSTGKIFSLYKNKYSGSNKLLTLNSDGELESEIETSGTFVSSSADGNAYYTIGAYEDCDIVSAESGKTVYESCFVCDTFAVYSDDTFIASNDNNMYIYNSSNHSANTLFKWSDVGIDQTKVQKICVLENGNIVVFLSSTLSGYCSSAALITPQNSSEKTTLTLGVFDTDPALMIKVAEFNNASDEYMLEVKQYYDREMDKTINHAGVSDAITKFNLDIISGNSPDIMLLNYDEIKNYAYKGLFADLTGYLNSSGICLPQNLLSNYTFNGVLSAIPPMIQVRTMVTRGTSLGGMEQWTLNDMINFVDENSGSIEGVPIFNVSANLLLTYGIRFNFSKYIDWENCTCNFENEDFYRLLDFCSTYGTGIYFFNPSISSNIAENDAVVYEVTINKPTDYCVIQQYLESDELTFIGFPDENGNGSMLEEVYGSLAISSSSENKDGAWSFIEYVLSTGITEYSPTSGIFGFPATSEARNQYVENVVEEPAYDEEGNRAQSWSLSLRRSGKSEIHYYPPSEEELAPIIQLLDDAIVPYSYDSTILDIILENAEEYFSGEKSVEEAAKQIQSKVKIYMNERK